MPTKLFRNTLKPVTHAALWLLFLSSTLAHAQVQDRPKVGPEQKKLEVWVGEWTYEGSVSPTPFGQAGKFTGKSSARMILDGLFLESRGEDKGVYGGQEIVYKSVGMRWYDPAAKTYLDQGFDNDAFVSRATLKVDGHTWTSQGTQTDSKGKTYKFRVTTTFSADGRTNKTIGELSSDDGKTWMPYWESTSKKVRD